MRKCPDDGVSNAARKLASLRMKKKQQNEACSPANTQCKIYLTEQKTYKQIVSNSEHLKHVENHQNNHMNIDIAEAIINRQNIDHSEIEDISTSQEIELLERDKWLYDESKPIQLVMDPLSIEDEEKKKQHSIFSELKGQDQMRREHITSEYQTVKTAKLATIKKKTAPAISTTIVTNTTSCLPSLSGQPSPRNELSHDIENSKCHFTNGSSPAVKVVPTTVGPDDDLTVKQLLNKQFNKGENRHFDFASSQNTDVIIIKDVQKRDIPHLDFGIIGALTPKKKNIDNADSSIDDNRHVQQHERKNEENLDIHNNPRVQRMVQGKDKPSPALHQLVMHFLEPWECGTVCYILTIIC